MDKKKDTDAAGAGTLPAEDAGTADMPVPADDMPDGRMEAAEGRDGPEEDAAGGLSEEGQAVMRDGVEEDGPGEDVPEESASEGGGSPDGGDDGGDAAGGADPDDDRSPDGGEASQEEPSAETSEDPDIQEEGDGGRRKGSPLRILLMILIFAILLAIGYLAGAYFYRDHFFPNTKIKGAEVGNMSSGACAGQVRRAMEDYSFSLLFPDGTEESIAWKDMVKDPSGKIEEEVSGILDRQDENLWLFEMFYPHDYYLSAAPYVDKDIMDKWLSSVPLLQEDSMTPPKDAYIRYDEKKKEYVIVPEEKGSSYDIGVIKEAVDKAVYCEKERLVVADVEGAVILPKVTKDDEKLRKAAGGMNEVLAPSITYVCHDGSNMSLDADMIKEWYSWDEDGNITEDTEKKEADIISFVDRLAMHENSVWTERDFHSTNSGDITVPGGTYGYIVAKEAEIEEIKKILDEGVKNTREPIYSQREIGGGNNGLGNTYIEADLSAQTVYVYKDGEMVLEAPCVSGTTSTGHGTPTGVFQIMYKDYDVDLKGRIMSNGQPEYVSHVTYWMPFYNGCGFHDSSWRSSYGGTIYVYSGSHGCVNLPYWAAQEMYGYVDAGTPVVVFY